MPSKKRSVSVTAESYERIRALAKREGVPPGKLIERALDSVAPNGSKP
ncbi:MAG: ribbon-helix-helix protein, CopG family [Acidobacteria bacterium]|nr:MAG: ribbon-helix-helix protein, CopG family [Acidobacteriota bacterium]